MYGKAQYSYTDIKYVDQLRLWQHIIGRYVTVNKTDTFCNPLRPDRKPGCYLREYNGVILLTDWARPEYNRYTCFHAYADLLGYSLREVATEILNGKDNFILPQFKDKIIELPKRKEITFEARKWKSYDVDYWSRKGITREQLEKDGVYSVERFAVDGHLYYSNGHCYAYTFPSGNVKLYQPFNKEAKWISNTIKEDVWIIGEETENCVISKAYKDAREIHNLTGMRTYAFLNERIVPEVEDWNHWSTFILYDNDVSGITGAFRVADNINRSLPKFIPKELGKDIDEVIEKRGLEYSKQILNRLLC
jgi:hypothetical protein